jgi:probable HAF family extracellular repeat protein
LGVLDGNNSYATALKDATHVTGSSTYTGSGSKQHAFYYNGSGLTDLLDLGNGTSDSHGRAITVVGTDVQATGYGTAGSYVHAFYYHNGAMHDLDPNGYHREGNDINASGHIAGFFASDSTDTQEDGFYYDGTLHDIGTLSGDASSRAWAINSSNVVAGWSGVLTLGAKKQAITYDSSGMIGLGTISGYDSSFAWAIDANGDVAGYVYNANNGGDVGFLKVAGHSMRAIGTLGVGNTSQSYGVNDSQQVVGYSTTNGNVNDQHAVLWESGTLYDLNNLIPSNSGWTLFNARAISDDGLIVGGGSHNGALHAFLLTPDSAPHVPGGEKQQGPVVLAGAPLEIPPAMPPALVSEVRPTGSPQVAPPVSITDGSGASSVPAEEATHVVVRDALFVQRLWWDWDDGAI